MFRSKLAARTVTVETALLCLDRVCEFRGVGRARSYDEGPDQQVISLDELIVVGRKQALDLRPKFLDWSRLLSAMAIAPVLLRLKNGNMIVALRNNQADPPAVVVSDPLYEDGKPFVLPQDALEQA